MKLFEKQKETRELIALLLESQHASGSDITHNLALLGGGNMCEGIRRMKSYGEMGGVMKTIVVVGSISALVLMTTREHRKFKKIDALDRAYNAGFQRGRDSETEFRDRVAELRERIRRSRETSQNDKGYWCRCDNCYALLNEQPDFTTETDQWTCTECGHVNDVSYENIQPEYKPEVN